MPKRFNSDSLWEEGKQPTPLKPLSFPLNCMVWLKKNLDLISSGFRISFSWKLHWYPTIPRVALCIFPHSTPIHMAIPWDDKRAKHLFPHCQTPSQILFPNCSSSGKAAGRILRGALPESTHRRAPSRSTGKTFILKSPLWGLLLCLVPLLGQVIYPGRPGVPTRASLRRHLKGAAGTTEGGVALCVF